MREIFSDVADILWIYWSEMAARLRRKWEEILGSDSAWLWIIYGPVALLVIAAAISADLARRDNTGQSGLDRLLEYIDLMPKPWIVRAPLKAIAYIAGSVLVAVLRFFGPREDVEYYTGGRE